MRTIIALLILVIITPAISAQEKSVVKWYSVEDIESLLSKEPRPVFIDTYTDWCGWCKRLDKDTFSDPHIAEILNEKFYPVKFNAESKETATFMGKQFVNDGKYGKSHPLAVSLLKGQMSFPTVVFLNKKGELLQPIAGYREPKDFEPILVFFGEEKYMSQSWDDFMKGFKSSY